MNGRAYFRVYTERLRTLLLLQSVSTEDIIYRAPGSFCDSSNISNESRCIG